MKALINFKICDNARECSGIAICPTKAMYYDEVNETIIVDDKKCTNCGKCEPECPIGAIMVSKNEEQYQQYIKDIDKDQRTIKDLFVDRYGAVSLSEFFLISDKDFENKINTDKLVLVEVYDYDTANCLLKSIPIKDITNNLQKDVIYYKTDKNHFVINKYNVTELPSLLVFQNNNYLGKVEGYYDIDDKKIFEKRIIDIIN